MQVWFIIMYGQKTGKKLKKQKEAYASSNTSGLLIINDNYYFTMEFQPLYCRHHKIYIDCIADYNTKKQTKNKPVLRALR